MAKKRPKRPDRAFGDRLKEGTWEDPTNRDDDDTKATLEQCERILESIEDAPAYVQDKAFDFFDNVSTTLKSVYETIKMTRHVTPKQQTAIDNWEAGVNRWLKNE